MARKEHSFPGPGAFFLFAGVDAVAGLVAVALGYLVHGLGILTIALAFVVAGPAQHRWGGKEIDSGRARSK